MREVICGVVLPCLTVIDLQALDTACTNKYLRPQLRQEVWKSYQYHSLDVVLKEYEVGWLCGIGVQIVSLTVDDYSSESDFIVTNIPTLKNLHITSTTVYCGILLKLATSCPELEELRVDYVRGRKTDRAVAALAQYCRQLHTLQIISEDLTDTGVEIVAKHCHQLHSLFVGDALSDAGVQALCDTRSHLKHFAVLGGKNITDASLIAIANAYPHLQSIILHSSNFTDDGLMYMSNQCHELRSVNVVGRNITSRGFTSLWAANPNLINVDTSNSDCLFDNDITKLAQCCPLLQKLNISCCSQITDAAVTAVAEHCLQLRSLIMACISNLSDASLFALGQHCHELKSLDVSCLRNISDVGVAALAAGCPLLQEIQVSSTNITDVGVVALARGCREFNSISLCKGQSIGIAAVNALAENCTLLSELNLRDCHLVDDACLCVLAQHCRNLTFLVFSNTKVSDVVAVISVIKSCRMLREIFCDNCFIEEKDRTAIKKYAGWRLEVNM